MAARTRTVRTLIAASPARVWAVLADVERWPTWTESMSNVYRLDGGTFQVGSRVSIEQPRLRPAIWRVTAMVPGSSFTWQTRSPGVVVKADHALIPTRDGTEVVLTVQFQGLLGRMADRKYGDLTEDYMTIEAYGLNLACST